MKTKSVNNFNTIYTLYQFSILYAGTMNGIRCYIDLYDSNNENIRTISNNDFQILIKSSSKIENEIIFTIENDF